jgi:hypothetical protein
MQASCRICRRLAVRAFSGEGGPVRVRKAHQTEYPEPRFDSIETEKALARPIFGDRLITWAKFRASRSPALYQRGQN